MQENFYQIDSIESRFKEVTLLPHSVDLSPYPLREHVGFEIRIKQKKEMGEVFTPLELVDKMVEIAHPQPDKFNMDLCAGHGQFTVRILRKFVNQNPDFNIQEYLKAYHWFNEFNPISAKDLVYIFGEEINLNIGPAQELKKMRSDENDVWLRGIFHWERGHWNPISDINDIKIIEEIPDKKPTALF